MRAVKSQGLGSVHTVILDSSSSDATPDLARAAGAEVVTIPRAEFDHGGTRQLAVDRIGDVPVVLFLTQDAIPADSHAFERRPSRRRMGGSCQERMPASQTRTRDCSTTRPSRA